MAVLSWYNTDSSRKSELAKKRRYRKTSLKGSYFITKKKHIRTWKPAGVLGEGGQQRGRIGGRLYLGVMMAVFSLYLYILKALDHVARDCNHL